MMYRDDDWTTVGYEAEETVGQKGATQAPRPSPAQIVPAKAQWLSRFVAPAPVPAGLTEPRAREIAREEVSSAIRQFAEAVDARIKEVKERLERAATPAEYRMPDAWREEELLYVLGFSTVTLDAAKQIGTITALPQRAFRGERLVVDVRRTANVQSVPVSITGLRVGEASQFVGSGAVPAETFTASAFGVRLGLTPAAPGIVIAVDFSAGAPIPSGEEIRITAALIGRVRRDG